MIFDKYGGATGFYNSGNLEDLKGVISKSSENMPTKLKNMFDEIIILREKYDTNTENLDYGFDFSLAEDTNYIKTELIKFDNLIKIESDFISGYKAILEKFGYLSKNKECSPLSSYLIKEKHSNATISYLKNTKLVLEFLLDMQGKFIIDEDGQITFHEDTNYDKFMQLANKTDLDIDDIEKFEKEQITHISDCGAKYIK